MRAQDSDIVLLDSSPLASAKFNRFSLPHRPQSRPSLFDTGEKRDYSAERVVEEEEADTEPAWLRALSAAGIPVCTLCGCRNPMEARDCLECRQPLRWKRTRRIKMPLDTSDHELKLKTDGYGIWGGALVALLLAQIATLGFMVSETVWPQLLASF